MKVKIVGLTQRNSGVSKVGNDYDRQDMYYVGLRGAVGVTGFTAGKVELNRAKPGLVIPDVEVGDVCDVDIDTDYKGNQSISFLEVIPQAKSAKA